MPGKHAPKEKRKAEHIRVQYKREGLSDKEAESRAWATVNKQKRGGKGKQH